MTALTFAVFAIVFVTAYVALAPDPVQVQLRAQVERASVHAQQVATLVQPRLPLRARLTRAIEDSTRRLSLVRAIERRMRLADLNVKAGEFMLALLMSAVLGAVLGGLIFGLALMPLTALLGLPAPYAYVALRRGERQRLMEASIAGMTATLAASLRSGNSLLQGLEVVSREVGGPLAREIGRFVAEVRVGVDFETAAGHLLERVGVRDLNVVFVAILVQRQVGGNLAEVLDRIQETITERQRLQGEVRALTAQGRLSGVIVGFLPAALLLMMQFMSPGAVRPLFVTSSGHVMLVLAAILEGLGLFFIRTIVRMPV